MRRVLSIAVLVVCWIYLGVAAIAEPSIELGLEEKGAYVYWFTYTDPTGVERSSKPERFMGSDAKLSMSDVPASGKDLRLHVMSVRTGNAAAKVIKPELLEAKPPKIELEEKDFQYVGLVRLRVVASDGKPVESAVVRVEDADGTKHESSITPVDEGVAVFRNVAAGQTSVKVVAEGLTKTSDSDIDIPAERDSLAFGRDIKVLGDVNTLQIASAPGTDDDARPKESSRKERRSSSGTNILSAIAGLIFVAVVIAVIYALLKSKGVTAKGALEKMGVALPETDSSVSPAPQNAAPAIDPNVCQFCGQQKDANGSCGCTVTPGAAPPVLGATPVTGPSGPRLIGTQGTFAAQIFPLIEGASIVGREASCNVALLNDATASRRHATINVNAGQYSITDMGSSNGTMVNGARITEQALVPGDEIQIGGTKFRFEV